MPLGRTAEPGPQHWAWGIYTRTSTTHLTRKGYPLRQLLGFLLFQLPVPEKKNNAFLNKYIFKRTIIGFFTPPIRTLL